MEQISSSSAAPVFEVRVAIAFLYHIWLYVIVQRLYCSDWEGGYLVLRVDTLYTRSMLDIL